MAKLARCSALFHFPCNLKDIKAYLKNGVKLQAVLKCFESKVRKQALNLYVSWLAIPPLFCPSPHWQCLFYKEAASFKVLSENQASQQSIFLLHETCECISQHKHRCLLSFLWGKNHQRKQFNSSKHTSCICLEAQMADKQTDILVSLCSTICLPDWGLSNISTAHRKGTLQMAALLFLCVWWNRQRKNTRQKQGSGTWRE